MPIVASITNYGRDGGWLSRATTTVAQQAPIHHPGPSMASADGALPRSTKLAIVRASAAFSAVTFVFVGVFVAWDVYGYQPSVALFFNLGAERNLATWWSASLNLLAGLLALENAWTDDRRHRRTWFTLSGLFTLFSITEIASLHEQLPDAMVIVFALLLAGLSSVGLIGLWRRPKSGPTLATVTVSLAVLTYTTVQEHIRGFVDWLDAVALLPLYVEESAEVLAALAFVVAMMLARRPVAVHPPIVGMGLPDPERVRHMRHLVASSTAIHAAGVLLISPRLTVDVHGDPAEWFPSAAFLVLALSLAWESARAVKERRSWGLALGALTMSALMVSALSSATASRFDKYEIPVDSRILITGTLVAFALVFIARRVTTTATKRLTAGLVAIALAEALLDIPALRYFVAGLIPATFLFAGLPGSLLPSISSSPRRARPL